MKVFFFLCVGAVIVLVLSGCGLARERKAAVDRAYLFYEALQVGNVDSAMVFLAPEFFERTPEEDFRRLIPEVTRRGGPIESFRLIGWHVDKNLNAEIGFGTYITLQFEVVHNGHQSTETLFLYRAVSGRDFRIIGYTPDAENPVTAKL